MITTNEGVTVEIEKLDKWVIQMTVVGPDKNGRESTLVAVLTQNQLIEQINSKRHPGQN